MQCELSAEEAVLCNSFIQWNYARYLESWEDILEASLVFVYLLLLSYKYIYICIHCFIYISLMILVQLCDDETEWFLYKIVNNCVYVGVRMCLCCFIPFVRDFDIEMMSCWNILVRRLLVRYCSSCLRFYTHYCFLLCIVSYYVLFRILLGFKFLVVFKAYFSLSITFISYLFLDNNFFFTFLIENFSEKYLFDRSYK